MENKRQGPPVRWRNAVLDMRENCALPTQPMQTREQFDAITALTEEEFEAHLRHARRPLSERRRAR